ncbi:MAG: zinc ribbon domain-containing protein [Atopobiaceae bacterium]|nr:zinc ribbon domain-containing protein [Atopobiaceae bacterium]
MYCNNCGAELDGDALFCTQCGAPSIEAGKKSRPRSRRPRRRRPSPRGLSRPRRRPRPRSPLPPRNWRTPRGSRRRQANGPAPQRRLP